MSLWFLVKAMVCEIVLSKFELQSCYYARFRTNTRKSIRFIASGGARGVMVIVAGYGHGDTSSNPGPD